MFILLFAIYEQLHYCIYEKIKINKTIVQNLFVALNRLMHTTGTINLSQLRDVTKALPGKLPVQIKFRLFPIDCDVRDVLF